MVAWESGCLVQTYCVGEPDLVIYTDASLEGWGCHIAKSDVSCGGRWTGNEKENHINYLEVKAVYLSILSHCKQMNGKHIRIMSDNTTTVAAINKQGSIRSKKINQLSRLIWLFAIENELWLSAAHCPGAINTEADRASRQFSDETEWTLENSIFSAICGRYGTPDIDLFAARNNHKVNRGGPPETSNGCRYSYLGHPVLAYKTMVYSGSMVTSR